MKLTMPVKMDPTVHNGLHVSGWKSEMVKHTRLPVSKRPDGVQNMMPGGFIGYCGGNRSLAV